VNKAIQFRRTESMFLAQFVTKQTGGFAGVMNQARVFRRNFRRMMINDEPVRFVGARFKSKIANPRRFLAKLANFPTVVMMRFQSRLEIEQFFRQPCKRIPEMNPSKSLSCVKIISGLGNASIRKR